MNRSQSFYPPFDLPQLPCVPLTRSLSLSAARTTSTPSVANAVDDDDDDENEESESPSADKQTNNRTATTSQTLFAGLCTVAGSFHAGGFQFELHYLQDKIGRASCK